MSAVYEPRGRGFPPARRGPGHGHIDVVRSLFKLAIYLAAVASGFALLIASQAWSASLAAALLLGVVYAHGLELQHEALHGILFRTARQNRAAGALLGFAMLTTFAETRARHLRHHRHVGTVKDVYDRSCGDFTGARALIAHVCGVRNLPDFAATGMALMRGTYAGPLRGPWRRRARNEFVATAVAAVLLLATMLVLDPRLALWGWAVPALVIAPVVHFFMTAAEHLGRARLAPDLRENTRSYAGALLWDYLVNYDNYHVEHHLFPKLPFHRLPALHARRCAAAGEPRAGYPQAIREVFVGIRACLRAGAPNTG
ncbi:MAG: fatty acid desaturase family protein [Pseudolabrys sp.]